MRKGSIFEKTKVSFSKFLMALKLFELEVKVPVFGILERNGKVKVEVVKDVKAETLLNCFLCISKNWSLGIIKGKIIYMRSF